VPIKDAMFKAFLSLLFLICGAIAVFAGPVWVNTDTGVYHYPGQRWYMHTKHGKLVDEAEAKAEGDRPTHNGQ
jgi:hypothetical protein